MNKQDSMWCRDLIHCKIHNASPSFFNEFNNQLKKEFKGLTGKKFDEKRWYLFLENCNQVQYYDDHVPPYAKLKGVLLFVKGRIDVNIIWIDRLNKIIHTPDEDISHVPIEFHWENLDSNSRFIQMLPDSLMDIRTKYDIDVPYPVYSYAGSIGVDTTLVFKLEDKSNIPVLEKCLGFAQANWNKTKLSQPSGGIIHSVYLISAKGKTASFSFDSGSADETVYKYIFEEVQKMVIRIKEVEIMNG